MSPSVKKMVLSSAPCDLSRTSSASQKLLHHLSPESEEDTFKTHRSPFDVLYSRGNKLCPSHEHDCDSEDGFSNSTDFAPLDLSVDNLRISSPKEELLHHLSPESEEYTFQSHRSPFDSCYIRGKVWPSLQHERDTGDLNDWAQSPSQEYECDTGDGLSDSNSSEESADFDKSSPASINNPSHKKRGTRRIPPTMREKLLEEAWERKKKLYLKRHLVNLKEHSDIRTLGRSSSDCGKPMRDICDHSKHGVLERSISDCGEPNKDPLITPNRLLRTRTRRLTDDDFEELKGCLDLGFRFDQRSFPDLCETLPALQAICAVTQNFPESSTASPAQSSTPTPTPSCRITSPGADPEEVKAKLRQWAQAVSCNARLCH